MILKMILKSFEFQCDFDFDFQITTSKMILILILNHLYLGDLILILKSSTYMMILPISGIRERQMLKVTKCIGVKSFVEALNMACELKITSGCKKNV